MNSFHAEFVRAFYATEYLLIYYVAAINALYLALIAIGFFSLQRFSDRIFRAELDTLMNSRLLPGISVIGPAFNEELSIRESVRSMLNLRYPDHEVVVVNDGSKDRTLDILIEEFRLYRSSRAPAGSIPTGRVRGVYESRDPLRLLVIDKENGGKADSLNAGINYSRKPLFAAVDSDSLIERDALFRIAKPFLDDERTVATGGIVRVANGCKVDHGAVTEVHAPKSFLGRIQTVEYLRAFLGGRVAFSLMNTLLIISGAFGVFRREAVLECGGFETGTVGEDMELVVRLHRRMMEKKREHRIVFVPEPVCWTEVPESWRVLRRQRNRWQRGSLETLWKHRVMLLNPRYGTVGMFGAPYFVLFEVLGPVVELFGYLMTVGGLIFGLIRRDTALLFFSVSLLFGILLSLAAVLLEEFTLRKYPSAKDLAALFCASVLESLGFRQLTAVWRVQAIIDGLRGKRGWGKMERRGFRTGFIFVVLLLGMSRLQAAEVPVWSQGPSQTDDLGGRYGVYSSPGCEVHLGSSSEGALEIHYSDRSDGPCGVFFHLFSEDASQAPRAYVDLNRYPWLHLTVQGSLVAGIRLADSALYARDDSAPAGRLNELAGQTARGGWRETVIPTERAHLSRREGAVLAISFAAGDEGILAVARIAFSDSMEAAARPQEVSRSMWLWEFGDCLADTALCPRVFAFAREQRIARIFAQISAHCDSSTGATCRLENPDRLRQILREASQQGLRIDALDGAPEFALRTNHEHVLSVVRAVLDFNREAAPDQRFGGLHLDIEPYLLFGFDGPARESILRQYVRLNRRVAALVKAAGPNRIEVSADIPFWYDETGQERANPNALSFGGKTQAVSRHIIDLLDEVVLMDYRKSAGGSDGIVAHATDEVRYASNSGKRVLIGVETAPQYASRSVFLAGLTERQWRMLRDNPVLFQRTVNGYRLQSVSAGSWRYVGVESNGDEAGLANTLEKVAQQLGLPRLNRAASESALSLARSALGSDYQSFQPVDLPGRAAFSVRSAPLEKISFWGGTRSAMDSVLNSVSAQFSKEPGFGGVAIHSYSSYSQMPE